jgi:hypothetical protein
MSVPSGGEQAGGLVLRGEEVGVEIDGLGAAPPLRRETPPRAVDQNPPHRLGRGAEEVRAALPVAVVTAEQAQVRLVHELGRIEAVAAAFVPQAPGGKPSELFVQEGQQPIRRPRVAPRDRPEDPVIPASGDSVMDGILPDALTDDFDLSPRRG